MEQHGISKLDLKRRNRMQVLKILKQNGPTSRIDIATELELTRAAVTIITNEMIDQNIICEIGEYKHTSEKAPRGRKKILIDINHHYKFALGITVEEYMISVGLSTLSGDVLDKRSLNVTNSTDLKAMYSFFVKAMNSVLNDNCLEQSSILGIGFAIHPSMYSHLDVTTCKGEPDFSKIERFMSGYTQLPMVFDSSVKGTAMANIDFKKDREPSAQNLGFLQYGNNLNFVFTNLNEPIISYDNRTDFVQKIIVNPSSDRICECGRRGCVENEISPSAIKKKAARVFSEQNTPYLWEATKGDANKITFELISEAFANRDKEIVKLVESLLNMTAVLINNLYFSTNPQRIVLHNFIFTQAVPFEKLKDTIAKIGGERVADAVSVSIIDDKRLFLSGCAIAVRELFFNSGGYSFDSEANQHHNG